MPNVNPQVGRELLAADLRPLMPVWVARADRSSFCMVSVEAIGDEFVNIIVPYENYLARVVLTRSPAGELSTEGGTRLYLFEILPLPGFWQNETSGVLKPAVEAFLTDPGKMTLDHIAAMRAYLRQWIESPVWRGPEIDALRKQVDDIRTSRDIQRWLNKAMHWTIDPL